jgi:hypothetical protein
MNTPQEVRVLVTGSRDWNDVKAVHSALHQVEAEHPGQPLVVVHGSARGADALAAQWATRQRAFGRPVCQEEHRADWNAHGRAAGPIRNQHMVGYGATVCLAFIKDGSRGASDCTRRAEAAGIPVRRWTA